MRLADHAGAPGHARDENRATIRLPNLRLRTIRARNSARDEIAQLAAAVRSGAIRIAGRTMPPIDAQNRSRD